MARYTGPKHKQARKVGVNILDKSSNSLARRLNVLPGLHGKKRKKRLSEFGAQMQEKQKAKMTYGLLEKQFRNLVKKVQMKKGDAQEAILGLLETRLDNLVFRLHLAKSRNMARQFVSHGHVLVNDKKVTIPSYQVKVGDVISLTPVASHNVQVLDALKEEEVILPYLKKEGVAGKLIRMPQREDLEVPFNLRPIIEYYSR